MIPPSAAPPLQRPRQSRDDGDASLAFGRTDGANYVPPSLEASSPSSSAMLRESVSAAAAADHAAVSQQPPVISPALATQSPKRRVASPGSVWRGERSGAEAAREWGGSSGAKQVYARGVDPLR